MMRITRSTRAAVVTAAAAALTLVLAACGGSGSDDTSPGAEPTTMAPSSPTGSAAASPTGTPAAGPHNDADVMFATGMVPHHRQAIEMSELLLDKDDIDPAVRGLAERIQAAQGPEIEQMRGWLGGWGEPVPSAGGMDDMATMDHSQSGGMSMPGMMSASEMSALADASGSRAADLFLEQMIGHHLGAVEMAETELREGENPDARQLAQQITTAQKSEIVTMTELLGG